MGEYSNFSACNLYNICQEKGLKDTAYNAIMTIKQYCKSF